MGIAIAEELHSRGAEVQLILGPSEIKIDENIKIKKVVTAEEMHKACMKDFKKFNVVIMAAAVADYSPKNKSHQKIKKNSGGLSIELIKTKDILSEAGKIKSPDQVLVGFALETNNEKANALKKLKEKNADLIVLNSMKDKGAGFGFETNRITIFDKNKNEYKFPLKTKKEVAADIVNTIIKYRNV